MFRLSRPLRWFRWPRTQGFQPNTSSDAPVAAGTQTGPQQVVVVGPNHTAQPRPVQIGIQNQQQAEITGGLQAGEQIVIVGQQGLKKGDKLAIEDGNGNPVGAAQRTSAAVDRTGTIIWVQHDWRLIAPLRF